MEVPRNSCERLEKSLDRILTLSTQWAVCIPATDISVSLSPARAELKHGWEIPNLHHNYLII